MRKSWIKLYAPFIALAALQAVIIVAAPSKAPDGNGAVSALGPLDASGQPLPLDDVVDPATGEPIDGTVVTDPGAVVTPGGDGTGGTTGGTTRRRRPAVPQRRRAATRATARTAARPT